MWQHGIIFQFYWGKIVWIISYIICIQYVFTEKCNVKIYIMLKSITFVNCFVSLEWTTIYLVNVNLCTHCSLLVFGWPCGTGIRKIHELILVLFSSLTPSLCPLSPHMILLIDGGLFYVAIFYFIYWFIGISSYQSYYVKHIIISHLCNSIYVLVELSLKDNMDY